MKFSVLIRAGLLATWLGCVAWLIRYEAFPHRFSGQGVSYRHLLRDIPAVLDSWMKVYFEDKHVGYLHQSIDMDERDGSDGENLVMRTNLSLKISVGDVREEARVIVRVTLDPQMQLLRFDGGIYAGQIAAEGVGVRTGNETFELSYALNDLTGKVDLEIPSDILLDLPASMFQANIRDGREGRVEYHTVFDPISREKKRSKVTYGARGEVTLTDGSVHTARKVRSELDYLVFESWIGDDGVMIRQQTPFGLRFEAADSQDAVHVPDGNSIDFKNVLPLLSVFAGAGNQAL